MEYRFFVVKMAHPYNDLDGLNNFDIFNLSKLEMPCLYLAEFNNRHEGNISLTPLQEYATIFPIDVIKEVEFKRLKNKHTFDFPNQLNKAKGFILYLSNFINYLTLCKNNQTKYYIKFGNNIIKCKKNHFFINGVYYSYNEIIYKIFICAWEYEDIKLCKYNIFKRLFK